VARDRADGTIVGVPHYALIEARAHELGRKLSREIQARQMGEIAARAGPLREVSRVRYPLRNPIQNTSGDIR
jgi:hypothetical protein